MSEEETTTPVKKTNGGGGTSITMSGDFSISCSAGQITISYNPKTDTAVASCPEGSDVVITTKGTVTKGNVTKGLESDNGTGSDKGAGKGKAKGSGGTAHKQGRDPSEK